MAVAIDIIIVALLIVCLFIGKRKGFVYTAVELIGWVVIAVVGVAFSKNIAEWIYDSFVRSAKPLNVMSSSMCFNISSLHIKKLLSINICRHNLHNIYFKEFLLIFQYLQTFYSKLVANFPI